ncbi:MAG: hypothetical protein H6797_03430 [Candidatus Nomurabacteria bacterium]|nr:MAG: hypothetical protein H6797_03430 [Candidatus Nomurabacteria bacterium]
MSEKNNNPENSSSSETEIVLLKSELAELFQANADQAELWTSDDLELPTEVVIAGTYHVVGKSEGRDVDVQIRQRIDENGMDYLIVIGSAGDYAWRQITDKGAWCADNGELPITAKDTEIIRLLIRPGTTNWTAEEAKRWATLGGMYEQADMRARRNK